jgi:hypothetical protein
MFSVGNVGRLTKVQYETAMAIFNALPESPKPPRSRCARARHVCSGLGGGNPAKAKIIKIPTSSNSALPAPFHQLLCSRVSSIIVPLGRAPGHAQSKPLGRHRRLLSSNFLWAPHTCRQTPLSSQKGSRTGRIGNCRRSILAYRPPVPTLLNYLSYES